MNRFCLPAIVIWMLISLSESFIDQEDLSFAVKELQGKVKLLDNQTKCGKYNLGPNILGLR